MGKHKLSALLSTSITFGFPAISAKRRRDLNHQVSPGLYHCLPIHQIHYLSPATPRPHGQRHDRRPALIEPYM